MKFKLTLEMDSSAFDSPNFAANMEYALRYVTGQLEMYVDGVNTRANLAYVHGPIHNRAGTLLGRWVVVSPRPDQPEPSTDGRLDN